MDSSSTPKDNDEGRHEESDKESCEEVEIPFSGTRNTKAKKIINTRSPVWDHFTRTEKNNNKCRCHYCGKIMSCYTTSVTSNLKKHLLSCKQHKLWAVKKGKQQVITPDGHLKLAKVSEAVFREASNEMLVIGELPLSFIESLAWRHFCTRMNLYKPHSRRTATRDIFEMFVNRKEAMKNIFKRTKQRVSLTTDIWTAPVTGASYMVITAHFIDASWELRKLIIGFKNIGDHKGETISYVLLQCLADWGIEKVFTITVDNATANTSALKRFTETFNEVGNEALVLHGEYLHMRCAAHIINLVVKDGLHDMHKGVVAIRNGVQYVRSSTMRLNAFKQRVETGKDVSRGSLPLDCSTRWNSTYLMLGRALNFRNAFDRMEAEDRLYLQFFLEVDKAGNQRVGPAATQDWEAVEKLVKFLKIFYRSTLVVSASSSLNSHKCYAEICTIERNLIKLGNSRDVDMQTKAKSMRTKFDKYWAGLKEINRLVIIASVLDPTKKLKFVELCIDRLYGKDSAVGKGLHDSVIDVMNRLFGEYSCRNASDGSSSSSSHTTATSSHVSQPMSGQEINTGESFDFDDDIDDFDGYERMDYVYNEMVNEKGLHEAMNELELYLKEPVEIPKLLKGTDYVEYDVLGWWRLNTPRFPVLSKMARDVLAMQISAVASESAFSTSGRVLDPYRSCLTHNTLEVLMCTEQWLKCEIHLENGVVTNSDLLADIELQDTLQREFGL